MENNTHKESHRIIKITVFVLAIACVGILARTYINSRADTEQALKVNRVLGSPISDSLVISSNGEVNRQLMELASKKIEELKLINQFMGSSPIAQMSKKYQDTCNCFVPTYFNKSFEDLFLKNNGVDPKRYLGSSEFSNWPDSLARQYEKQDFYSLRNGVYEFDANFVLGGELKKGRFVKWSDYDRNIYMYYLTTQNK